MWCALESEYKYSLEGTEEAAGAVERQGLSVAFCEPRPPSGWSLLGGGQTSLAPSVPTLWRISATVSCTVSRGSKYGVS